jgi:hypothetical protein
LVEYESEAMKEEIKLSRYEVEGLCKTLDDVSRFILWQMSEIVADEWVTRMDKHLQELRDKLAGRIE